MSSAPKTIATGTVTYYGPTDTSGSRHIVRWKEDGKRKQRTVGYNYAARDAGHDAVVTAFRTVPERVATSQRWSVVEERYSSVTDFTVYAY